MASMKQTKKELLEEIEKLEAEVVRLIVGECITLTVPPVFVRFYQSGPVVDDEGAHLGVVSPGWAMQDPPAETLRLVPHTLISAAEYEASASKFGAGG